MSGSVWPGARAMRYAGLVGLVDGVVTTGIYCRPDCAARPLPEHVIAFPLAAAAEAAGMRACLRCRPYRMAQSVSWSVSPELVCRAVRMIVNGTLDRDSEAGLARRLDVSGRHLRRMFLTHLGVTPDALARSVRVHFARRLLDDTDLTITEIAFAAGFGCVRQFNRECRRVFRDTPSGLRAGRGSAFRCAADGGLALRLWFTGPLDWPALAAFLAARAIPGVEHVDGAVYRRTITVDGDPGVLELSPGGPGGRGRPGYLLLRAHLPHWAGLMHLVAQVRRIAGLDEDIAVPRHCLAGDPVLGSLLTARPGVRVPGAWDPFEVGVTTIIAERRGPGAARTAAAGIAERFGRPVPGLAAMRLSHTFPAPRTLSGAVHGLSAAGLCIADARAVSAFASAVSSRVVRLDSSAGLGQLVASLMAVPGISHSAAHYIALRMGEPDAYPAADPQLRAALAGLSAAVGNTGLEAAGWRPWRAYATASLWAAGPLSGQPGLLAGTGMFSSSTCSAWSRPVSE